MQHCCTNPYFYCFVDVSIHVFLCNFVCLRVCGCTVLIPHQNLFYKYRDEWISVIKAGTLIILYTEQNFQFYILRVMPTRDLIEGYLLQR